MNSGKSSSDDTAGLSLLVPAGWNDNTDLECEPTYSDDVMEAFLADVAAESGGCEPHPRFAEPFSDTAVEQARREGVPKTTQKDTLWCISLLRDWIGERNKRCQEQVPTDFCAQSIGTTQHWMCRFILEVRKKDGSCYLPDTLHHIVCGILRYLRQNRQADIDFFKDGGFASFRQTLDAEMKRLKRTGAGSSKCQAEPLTAAAEELLWQKGVLGDHSPLALLNTVFYFTGMCFALRSGEEHRRLRFETSQVVVVRKPGERAYLQYTEDSSKNNQGGLKDRKCKTKQVVHHENTDNPARCPVRVLERYNTLCPANRPGDAFYLQPLKKPKSDCWFSIKPMGHNTLNNMVKEMCKAAGITGFKTNHSLRATTAIRLYQAGVDEQLIMERTGYRSLDGVRSYKRTSTEQREALSHILNLSAPQAKQPKLMQHIQQSTKNTQDTDFVPFTISLHGCTNVSFNVTYNSH